MAKPVPIVPKASYEDPPVVPPPATFTVQHDHKVVLYTADGKPLVRKAGF